MSYQKFAQFADEELDTVNRVLDEVGNRVSFPREVVKPLFDLWKLHNLPAGTSDITCNSCVKHVVSRFKYWRNLKIEADATEN
jgi:hypothetical protein